MEEQKVKYARMRVPPHPLEIWSHVYVAAVSNGRNSFAKDFADEAMMHYIDARAKYMKIEPVFTKESKTKPIVQKK